MDNVKIVIPKHKLEAVLGNRFTPSFHPVRQHGYWTYKAFNDEFGPFRRFVQNPPAGSRASGIVYPNLTIYEKVIGLNYSCNLYISCSLPKLLFGHSYRELKDGDFPEILRILKERLSDMGVRVSEEQLADSTVQSLHYARNIRFNNLNEANIFLERLSKTSYSGWHENNVKTYSHDGKAVRFHSNTHEIVFYLKYADLLQKGSRSVDRNKTLQEIQLAKEFKRHNEIPPIVRLEIRYNKTPTISNHLKNATNIDSQYWKFKEIYSQEISRQVMNHFWQKLISDKFNYYLLCKIDLKDVYLRVQESYKKSKSKDVDEFIGMFSRLQTLGVKGVKEDMLFRHSRQTWNDKRKLLNKFAEEFVHTDESLINIVTEAINDNPIYQEGNLGKQLELF